MNDKEWIEALQKRVETLQERAISLSDSVNELCRQRTTLEKVIENLKSENLKLEQEIKELKECSES